MRLPFTETFCPSSLSLNSLTFVKKAKCAEIKVESLFILETAVVWLHAFESYLMALS